MSLSNVVPTAAHSVPGVDLLRPGKQVGPWRIECPLGRGGMGTVYAVVHDLIGKRAAMKVIHREAMTGNYTAERLLIEARAVNVISHPNIVDIFDSGTLLDGRPFLVMERLRGKTLGDRLDEGHLPPLEVIGYLLPLCDALAAAHEVGVVHSDIKLDNVFIVDGNSRPGSGPVGTTIKLLDWGIASMLDLEAERTTTEPLVGTPRYLPPERARGERVTPASDVYSLGVLAYELFLEEPPFAAPTTIEVLQMHLYDMPPAPGDVWPQIPPALEDLLLDMLAKTPALRPSLARITSVLRAVQAELVRATPPVLARGSEEIPALGRDGDAVPAFMPAEPVVAIAAVPMIAAPMAAEPMAVLPTAIPLPVAAERTPTLLGQGGAMVTRPRRRHRRWAAVTGGVAALGMTVWLFAPMTTAAPRARMAIGTPAHPFVPIAVAAAAANQAPSADASVDASVDAPLVAMPSASAAPRPRGQPIRAATTADAPPAAAPAKTTPGRPTQRHPRPPRLHPDAVIDTY